jgi:hypothetical protein
MSDNTAKIVIRFDTTQLVEGAKAARSCLKSFIRHRRKIDKQLRKLKKAQRRLERTHGHRG